ncbi:hypothetical protein OUZ56_028534 [Daphnia magna]|uniref:Uncharacterized protein n=1 Tax=Daphnia magna TaxID=35525 RepID=A0ABR0B4A5_9CRUS|nr:hypothetical protein OUZ56_028534 [Daphnia magna]
MRQAIFATANKSRERKSRARPPNGDGFTTGTLLLALLKSFCRLEPSSGENVKYVFDGVI